VKELQERVIQIEKENTQLKEQLETSKPMKTALDDFRRCALEQEEELHKTRQNLYIHIQKLQDIHSNFREFKTKKKMLLFNSQVCKG